MLDRCAQRRDKLQRLLARSSADTLLVTSVANVTYLTGFTGDDSYLLIGPKLAVVLSDPRYTEQLSQECPDLAAEIRPPGTALVDTVVKTIRRAKLTMLGVEAASMTVGLHGQLVERLPGMELRPTQGVVEQLRQIKDREELEEIRMAIQLAERAYRVVRASLRPELTEREVAFELERQIRAFGGAGCSFPPIVAVGPRAALPHARPTETRIGDHGLLLVDWGARARQYISDLTRVMVTAKISPKLERIYGVVLKAQRQAIAAIRPGARLCDVDAVARTVIAKAGFGKFFGHGLGHGIGLEVHESPRFAANQSWSLEVGMVVTVEPGIYLPQLGGVRVEDDVLVTKSGHEVLSTLPKEWEDCQLGASF